ncbi:MAG TPA: ferritin-like domain-containing protein, partial [Actinomycetota bacterium]
LAGGLVFALDVCLSDIAPGQVLELRSTNPALVHELPAWCRGTHNALVASEPDGDATRYRIRRGNDAALMFKDEPDEGIVAPIRTDGEGFDTRDWLLGKAGMIPEHADPTTGFSPRGALVEEGSPRFPFTVTEREQVWAHSVASLYEQATEQQWDASRDIDWAALPDLPSHLDKAVAQIMTHLAENEYAALYVPAKFIPKIHPRFTEVVMFLSTQVADEARHIEAFTKRALAGGGLRYSTAQTQESLKSLLEQEDFSQASFLLSVLGEGAFLEYLAFIERYAPDPVTADIVRRARVDEARHVAFGVEHARHFIETDPERAEVLRSAVERRASFLAESSATSPHIEEALVILAAGGVDAGRLTDGVKAVRELHETMHRRRMGRLRQLGFDATAAEEISELHTANFM